MSTLAAILVVGVLTAIATAPLGCFAIWRRLTFFADATAHASLAGAAAGLAWGFAPTLGAAAITFIAAWALIAARWMRVLRPDVALAALSLAGLTLGGAVIHASEDAHDALEALAFGKLAEATWTDAATILVLACASVLVLARYWRPLALDTLDPAYARAMGVDGTRADIVFMTILALNVAFATQTMGVLLAGSLFTLPAAFAQAWARSPRHAMGLAIIAGVGAVVVGVGVHMVWDLALAPAIAGTALVLALGSVGLHALRRRQRGD